MFGQAAVDMSAVSKTRLERSIGLLLPGLRRYARSLVKDREQADDLVQDCLERIVGAESLPRESNSLSAFTYTVLHNLAMDYFRRRARRGIPVPLDAIEDGRLSQPADQEAALAERNLLQALDRLPEHMRAVLLLVGVEDLSYNEAASTLGIPIGTLMSRLHRAREHLRRDLSIEEGRPR